MSGALDGKTILQVIPELETGGAERTTLEVAEAIIAAGGRALVVSEGGPMVTALESLGANHVTMPAASKNPLTLWANRKRLERLIAAEGIAIVHARSRAPAWSAYYAARNAQVPFITTYHGIYRAGSGLKRYYNSVMARGDYVIANSAYTAEAVLAEHMELISDPARLIVIHRGVDLRQFSPDAVSVARVNRIEQAWRGRRATRILLPGRLTGWKGQRVMIEAARILRQTRQEDHLRIVLAGSDQGRTGYRRELEDAIEELELTQTVILPGNCEDMPAGIAWADLVVSASTRPEAFGRVAVEAQAMARPVIASDHGGARETVIDGETGWRTPPGDAQALADAIGAFLDMDAPAREAMGQAARENAAQRFSVERMTGDTIDVYRRALDDREALRIAEPGKSLV